MRYILLIFILFLLSCTGNKNVDQKNVQNNPEKTPITLDHVKKQLCYQFIFNKEDSIRCPDSIYTFQLRDTSLYLTQSYYGNGYGAGIWFNLIKLETYSYKILDSLLCYRETDWFEPETSRYNDSLDWFYYIAEGSGTNHYSTTKYIVRIENNRFAELISFPQYVSDMDPEVKPMTYTSLETKEVEVGKMRIILKAKFESGYIKNDKTKPTRTLEDVVTFEYSDSSKSFIWKKSTNMAFKDFWLGKKGYDWL